MQRIRRKRIRRGIINLRQQVGKPYSIYIKRKRRSNSSRTRRRMIKSHSRERKRKEHRRSTR